MASSSLVLALLSSSRGCPQDATCDASSGCSGQRTFENPLITDSQHELADPAFLDDRPRTQRFYIYPTGDQSSIDVYHSSDLVSWTKGAKVLSFSWPCPPAFLFGPWFASMLWAPDVFFDERSGRYFLYYTRCLGVGVAVADSPLGPFSDLGPLLPSDSRSGPLSSLGRLLHFAIDAHMFKDSDGQLYLYYVKLNFLRYFTSLQSIWVQPMGNATHPAEGVPAKVVLAPSQPWEFMRVGSLAASGINEGPWVLKLRETYYLMYSGAGADTRHYAIGYATSASPTGPFVKSERNPISSSGAGVFGPGHHAVLRADDGQYWCLYHAKGSPEVGWDRMLALDPLHVDQDGVLSVNASRGIRRPAPHVAAP